MITLVCFALKEEAAPFHKIAARKPGIFTLIVGIGRQNAGNSIRDFLTANTPDLVLTCGFAGGLNPELQPGEVIFAIDGSLNPNYQLPAKLLAAGAKPATFTCADRIATTVAEKQQLRRQTNADAVEMESGEIHTVCQASGITCATIRVISDAANEDLPLDFNTLSKPDKSLDFSKLAWAIARSPRKIGALLALQKRTSFAAQRLAAVLQAVICQ